MKSSDNYSAGGWQESMLLGVQSFRRGFGKSNEDKVVTGERVGVRFLAMIFLILLGVTAARIVYLQVFERGLHTLVSANNHLERKREEAQRGIIFDRNGEALVENVALDDKISRKYILGSSAAHLVGYISEVREDEIGCEEGQCYAGGQVIGRTGVEKSFEGRLRGRDGGRLLEMNAMGEVVRELGVNEPERGEDVTLSIDARLQRLAAEAIGERTGSIVAIDLTGKVLALYSSPSYDPNLFTVNPNPSKLETLLTDEDKQYFLDRPLSGVYPPGSVFKMVTAYAGLETGKITPTTLIEDTGEIKVGEYRYGNWYFDQYGRTEGELNLVKALARSNDVFFYKVGEMVGVDTLVEYAKKFGYGSRSGVELPGEVTGLVPTRLWKERATGEKWFLGNTYHMSIGQGDLQVTPMQVTRMTAAAVSGRLCQVSLVLDRQIECEELGLKQEFIEEVKTGMKQVCAAGGTAFPFFEFEPWVLCKTGTAQHAGQKSESDEPHAWIVVAYPGDNPQMVLTVMLDSAGEGSYEAGPVAKEILERWRDLGNY